MGEISGASAGGSRVCRLCSAGGCLPPCSKPVAASLPAPLPRAHTSECETRLHWRPSSDRQFHKRCWQWLCCPWAESILNPRHKTHHGGTETRRKTELCR